MVKVKIEDKLNKIEKQWDPHIVGALNGQHVKLAKIKGEFIWHKHDDEDEMFYVIDGEFQMQLRDQNIDLKKGEFLIVPRGVEHRPVAKQEASIMLFEPMSTLNTGNTVSELTHRNLTEI